MFEFSNKKILPKIRLFLDIKLDLSGDILNQKLQINNNDFDYLIKVMRQRIGDEIMIFNGFDGDFIGKIIDIFTPYKSRGYKLKKILSELFTKGIWTIII